jgi:inward rectifier potassium channel
MARSDFTPDGRPNVDTIGLSRRARGDAYVALLATPWWRLIALFALGYFGANAVFACAYLVAGDAIANARPGSFSDAFFFSVQTMATIGYGGMAPRTLTGNLIVALESMVGVIGFAMVTGLTFAKFSRPTARVIFSRVAVVSSRDGVRSLMFRMANERGRSAIVEAQAHVVFARDERTAEGEEIRRFHDLPLLRNKNALFALSWTAVHPITEGSPLHGVTPEMLHAQNVAFIVSVTGIDETVTQTVHARHTYGPAEVVWEARFADILSTAPDGRRRIDYSRFHEVTAAPSRPGTS